MFRRFFLVALATFGFVFASAAAEADIRIDGVPLPDDVAPLAQSAASSPFAGAWFGEWDGVLKTVLVVERVEADGAAKVVYAVADSPRGGFKAAWARYDGKIEGDRLTMFGMRSTVVFDLSPSGRLRGVFDGDRGFTVLTRRELGDVRAAGAKAPWSAGANVFLETDLVEDGRPVRLEAVVFRPPGAGPFPLAVVNHGSTGNGAIPATATWDNAWLADELNVRGWIVAFPQRRGRGKSDGLYDEGFGQDRSLGYTCETARSLGGADRALIDLEAAIGALKRRPDVSAHPVLLAGLSRGGALSVAYAGGRPNEVAGVVNFVGGWMGDGCETAEDINQALFRRGGGFPGSTLWIYGHDDAFYSMAHSRRNFQAFRQAGGSGVFVEATVPGRNNGHWVLAIPPLWRDHVATYLDGLKRRE